MPDSPLSFAYIALIGFALLLFCFERRLPLRELFSLIERSGREAALLISFGLLLGFLLDLAR